MASATSPSVPMARVPVPMVDRSSDRSSRSSERPNDRPNNLPSDLPRWNSSTSASCPQSPQSPQSAHGASPEDPMEQYDSNASSSRLSSKKKSTPGIALHGDFIKADTMSEHPEDNDRLQKLQMLANRAATHKYVTHFMAVVILFDAYCNCVDIDSRAELSPTPAYVAIGAGMCLLLYTIEMAILLFARGCVILKDFMVGIDLGVILCGYAEMILDGVTPDLAARIGILRILRLARIMRLLRLLRRTRALRELQKLVIMMSTCLKALLWSFVFCFVIMTIWAMLLVELVYPLILDMDKSTTVFSDCEQCIRATSSVMHANLLLFKTVIAGDSWGLIAVPVIETHPATAVIFVGSLLTLVFGVLNLIVAVVVDTFADARDRDILNLAEEMEADVDADRRFLEKMFNRIDSDGSGQLTLEQLVQGARKDHEFQSRLRVMDIDEIDLHQLFEMIDTDCSGFIEAPEFIRPLSRWVHDSKTAPRFIKYNMMRTMHQQDEMIKEQEDFRKFVQRQFHGVSQRIDDLASCLPPLISRRVPAYDSWERNVTEPLEELEEAHTREEDFVEQPRLSQKVTLKRLESQSEDGVKDAMERLGRIVLRATELALKDSSGMIESMLLDMGQVQSGVEMHTFRQREHRRHDYGFIEAFPRRQREKSEDGFALDLAIDLPDTARPGKPPEPLEPKPAVGVS